MLERPQNFTNEDLNFCESNIKRDTYVRWVHLRGSHLARMAHFDTRG